MISVWRLEPSVLLGAVVALALFAQAFVRLRKRGRPDLAPWSRAVLFLLGVASLTLALVSPLDAVGDEYLLSGHMLQHALLLDVGPALILVALRGPLLLFMLPPAVLGPLAQFRPLRALLGLLLRPLWTFALWAGALLVWHLPRAYDYALAHPWAHDLEHLSFLLIGLLVWTQLVDPTRRRVLSDGGRVGYALALFAAGHALLHPAFFAGGVLYPPYAEQSHRLLGLSPLADQHWAAIVMTVDQVLVLGTFVAVVLWRRRMAVARTPQVAS